MKVLCFSQVVRVGPVQRLGEHPMDKESLASKNSMALETPRQHVLSVIPDDVAGGSMSEGVEADVVTVADLGVATALRSVGLSKGASNMFDYATEDCDVVEGDVPSSTYGGNVHMSALSSCVAIPTIGSKNAKKSSKLSLKRKADEIPSPENVSLSQMREMDKKKGMYCLQPP
ncbi:hypothetical protein GOP47_0026645 [Adiantum capillus-veneris]|nr:hypothetical protein GOP47_0026645 [Adiantum capillus-veneris]